MSQIRSFLASKSGVLSSFFGGSPLLGRSEVLPSKECDQKVDVNCNCHKLGVHQGNVHPTIQKQLPEKDILARSSDWWYVQTPVFDGEVLEAFFQLGKGQVRGEETLCEDIL